jgi:hypothetical protein
MRLLFENPWPIAIIGGLLAAMLTGGLLRTGRIALLWAILAVLGLTLAGVLIERRVVTPTEEVELTLHNIAAELEANEIEGVVAYIASTAPELKREARSRLRDVTIEEVKIKRNLSIVLSAGSEPNRATARFNVVIVGTDKAGALGRRQGAWFFVVQFRKEKGIWRVESYEQRDPREGLRQTNANAFGWEEVESGSTAKWYVTQTEYAVILREPQRPKNLPKTAARQERVNSSDFTSERLHACTDST